MSAATVTIRALGAQGDGIADSEDGPLFVPFALPGESVAVAREKNRGTMIAIKTAAPERVDPPCPHFGPDGLGGACGGCALQHYDYGAYNEWKRGLVVRALAERGLDVPVEPIAPCAPGARRRVTLTARRTDKGLLLGFSAVQSHRIVPITTCVIAHRAIADQLPALRKIAGAVASGSKPFQMTVTVTVSGLDIAVKGGGRLADRQRLMAIETVLGLPVVARLTSDGDVLVEPRKPLVHFGRVTVSPPPGAFLQASAAAEQIMADHAIGHLASCRKVADLFAGCGTFALRLAEMTAVHAVEGEAAPLAALEAGSRAVQGLKPVTVERRDLFRSPLMPHELKSYDGLVFDPPRAGAEAQSRELARSRVGRVVAVSCNPVTLARDLSILVDGGFAIRTVKPIDQFLWSPHVEAVALLER